MNELIKYVLIALVLILFVNYYIIPFMKPRLLHFETTEYLEKNNYIYVQHKLLSKKEKKKNYFNGKKGFSIQNIISVNEYKLLAYSKKEDLYKLFWVRLIKRRFLSKNSIDNQRRILIYVEETDKNKIENAKNELGTEIRKLDFSNMSED